MAFNQNELIAMGQQRTRTYDHIIGAIMTLPDASFLEIVRSDDNRIFLDNYLGLEHPTLTKACKLIKDYLEATKNDDEKALLETLAVDRTRLLRTPFKEAFKIPYESQYSSAAKAGGAGELELRQMYHSSGYAPKDSNETMDFFAVQLDYLRVLCLKMAETPEDISKLLEDQKKFLEDHPGSWIPAYVKEASPHATTDFYRGWLLFMQGFLEIEQEYLQFVTA